MLTAKQSSPSARSLSSPLAFQGKYLKQQGASTSNQTEFAMTAPLNIILVNLGYSDFGCYGPKPNSTLIWTKWRKRGRASPIFSMAPLVCSPFRGAMLTDCYPPKDDSGKVIMPNWNIRWICSWGFRHKRAGGKGGKWYFWRQVVNPSNTSDFLLVGSHKGGIFPT